MWDLELRILKSIDSRDKKAKSNQRNRSNNLRNQTPESTSSETVQRLFSDSSRAFSGTGMLPVVVRGQTPNINSDNTYTASKHIILNSQEFITKGSRGKRLQTNEDGLIRGRSFLPERDGSGSSSSNSPPRQLTTSNGERITPQSSFKHNDLSSFLIIQSKSATDQKHSRKTSPQSRSKENSHQEDQILVNETHNDNTKNYEQHTHVPPLKSIIETNTERESQKSIAGDVEDTKFRFKSYKPDFSSLPNNENSTTLTKGGVFSGPATLEQTHMKKPHKKHLRATSNSKSRTMTSQSFYDNAYAFAVQAKQLSLNDSLNQSLFTLGVGSTQPPNRDKKRQAKDSLMPSFTIKSNKSKGVSLNDSSII